METTPTFLSYLYALLAIARGDWRRYWRYPLNAVAQVFQPVIWLTPVFFMGQAFSANGAAEGFAAYTGTTDYMSFILIGTALNNFITAVFWGMGYALKNDMDTGVLESNWLAPIPRPLLLVGKTLSSLLLTAITSASMLVVAGLLFGFRTSGSALAAAAAAIPMLIGLYGFGFAFAALVLVLREANSLVDVSSFLVMLFSGANFPVTVLPRWLLPIALIMPLTYGFDVVRGFLLKTRTLLPIPQEIGLLVFFMFLMVALGLWVFRILERRVRVKGTLGQH